MENKKPIYKSKWGIAIIVLLVLGLIFGNNKNKIKDNPKEISTQNDSSQIPKSIESAEIKLVPQGFKVSCAFLKDLEYVKVKGNLKIEVYNWNMSDNVDFTDPDTYDLGEKMATQEFKITPDQLKKDMITFRFENIINCESKPKRTYLTARFSFIPDNNKSVKIISGSTYQTL
jgi:hypothetical protein